MTGKKTLYEILGVSPQASYPDIQAAYQQQLLALEGQQSTLARDDYVMQTRLLKVAYSTLSGPQTRDSYDAQLHLRAETLGPAAGALAVTPASANQAAALRADAMLLRAESLALRADAMGLKADTMGAFATGHDPSSELGAIAGRAYGATKRVVFILGTLGAMVVLLKVLFMILASDRPSPSDDKVFLQEYYQTHGVRPASRLEAELMDKERRAQEAARRAQAKQETEKENAARAERQFEEDARRRGDQASIELQYAEERARQARQQEERQREEERREKAENERARIEAEQQRYRRVLETP